MVEAPSRMNRYDRLRLDLVDRLRLSENFAFTPTQAAIGLTRRCEARCLHCAPASEPHSAESLSLRQVGRFIEGLESLPINVLYVEGGEPMLDPDLVTFTFRRALEIFKLNQFHLETNLFWCDSKKNTEEILGDLARLGFEEMGKTFAIAGNIDQLHASHSPLGNNLRLIHAFYDYFPNGQLFFFHSYHPGDSTLEDFAAMLREDNLLVDVKTQETAWGKVIYLYNVMLNGRVRELSVDNKFPMLVGRGKNFRFPEYFTWRRSLMDVKLTLRDPESRLYIGRPCPEILSLGWDGLFYHDVMFMHTATYPIGDIATDTPLAAFFRANSDLLIQRLITRGMGAIFRNARRVIPDLEAAYAKAKKDGLTTEEFAFDLLASPEHNLSILERIVEEESEWEALAPIFRRSENLASARTMLELLGEADWTGLEYRYLASVLDVASGFKPAEIIETLSILKEKNETSRLSFSFMKNTKDPQKNAEIMRSIAADPELLQHFVSTTPKCYRGKVCEAVIKLVRVMVLGESEHLERLISQLDEPKIRDAIFMTIDNFLAVNLECFVKQLIALPSLPLRARLISRIYVEDPYDDKVTARDLLHFALENGDSLESILSHIADEKTKAGLAELARSAK